MTSKMMNQEHSRNCQQMEFSDLGLVSNDPVSNSRRWFLIFLSAASSFFIAALIFIYLAFPVSANAATQDVVNEQIIAKYILRGGCDVVLVGSSIMHRLDETYFSTPVCNLALPGDGNLTGLTVLDRFDRTPQLVIVELNVLRDINNQLVGLVDIWPAWLRELQLKKKMGTRLTDVMTNGDSVSLQEKK